MSVSPIANRSFLHGDRKPSPTLDRTVYATLDSLALKRATLPLQLLPVNEGVQPEVVGPEMIDERSSLQVDAANPSSSPPHPRLEPREATVAGSKIRDKQVQPTSGFVVRQDRKRCSACLQKAARNGDNSDTDACSISRAMEADVDNRISPRRRVCCCAPENLANDSRNDFSCSSYGDNPVSSGSEPACESSSDGYEEIETFFHLCTGPNGTGQRDGGTRTIEVDGKFEQEGKEVDELGQSSSSRKTFVKSKSTNDLTSRAVLTGEIEKLAEEEGCCTITESFSEEKLTASPLVSAKRKKRFARNVLHFVPEYIAKSSGRREKGKNDHPNGRPSSPRITSRSVGAILNDGYATRALSRDELKYLTISSPTNFVHVASATSPNLVSNENTTSRDHPERAVITHKEKCATLPLLVTRNGNSMADNGTDVQYFDVMTALKRELLSELDARNSKPLDSCQQVKRNGSVKTANERERESTASLSRAELRANFSFLWSNRTMTRSKSPSADCSDEPDQLYDDVGPLNLIADQNDYDDVAVRTEQRPSMGTDENLAKLSTILQDPEDIYDDVVGPKDTEPRASDENAPSHGDDGYLFISNEYSDVDKVEEDDQDVYDDVGLPSEERVNSLYAGFTSGSILESVWTKGKESEWEDLEDTSVSAAPCRHKDDLSIDKRDGSNKKKSGQKFLSRKTRSQRSKVSKSGPKSSSDPATNGFTVYDNTSDDSTYESLHSFRPVDDFTRTGSDAETLDESINQSTFETEQNASPNRLTMEYSEAPTKPTPPPPLEASLTRTLGKRIKMFRTTWSITKGSLGRIRRRSSVVDDRGCGQRNGPALSSNSENHSNLVDGGKYSSILGRAKNFRKSVTGSFSTFYLDDYGSNANQHSTNRPDAEPMYNNCREQPDHYSVLADQETLYQFYAEAAARVALDSSSDGYKEVESRLSSLSTTNLAKPGHRTLWCQTPQVANTGLLQRLNTEEKKVQEAKFEILTSEASYLNSLRVLRDEFLNDPSINELLTTTEKDKLFGGIPAVLYASERFLAELESLWRREPMLHELPDVLLQYADKCVDVYVPYCSNQVSIDSTLKDLRTRKGSKFDETIMKIEGRESCQNLSLHSFLMLPMQRITRLPLLADAVLSRLPLESVDRSDWEKVLSTLNYVVTQCNEAARAAAQEIEIENLARKLNYSAKINPIVLKGKHLIKSGPVVQLSTRADTEYKLTFGKRFNKTPLFLLLLTDHLLVAKYKSNTPDESYIVVDTCKRSLIALEPVPEDSPFAGRNGMLLTLLENYCGHQVDYVLTCESDTERQRWLEAVSPLKRGLIGEALYEVWDCPQVVALYCYLSNQPDELSVHPGDVINVFRKMPDGWYHGEKLLNGEQGWFPGNFTKEVASEHARAKNIKQRHRFITLSGNPLQRKVKHQSIAH